MSHELCVLQAWPGHGPLLRRAPAPGLAAAPRGRAEAVGFGFFWLQVGPASELVHMSVYVCMHKYICICVCMYVYGSYVV